ncbi:MAG: hypothetical protein NZ528_16825 [Caldilineales bacterium]|nr:hypothetical protein [Caldilineales bacterium]
MIEGRAYLRHLRNSHSLVTTREAKRAGFVEAVLEKSRIADGFVQDARTLKIKAEQARTPDDLLNIVDIQAGLLTAAGFRTRLLRILTKPTEEPFWWNISRMC